MLAVIHAVRDARITKKVLGLPPPWIWSWWRCGGGDDLHSKEKQPRLEGVVTQRWIISFAAAVNKDLELAEACFEGGQAVNALRPRIRNCSSRLGEQKRASERESRRKVA